MALALGSACSGAVDNYSSSNERIAPELRVANPPRGLISQGATSVEVSGFVVDHESGVAAVTVNGAPAAVDAAGHFTVNVPVAGLVRLETVVTDRAGNSARDVRSVLGGDLVPADELVAQALKAHVGPEGVEILASLMAQTATATDVTPLASAANPVFTKGDGGCLSVRVDVEEVTKQGVNVVLTPVQGAIATDVVIDEPVIQLRASYRVACIGGASNIIVSATRARLEGRLGLRLVGRDVAVSVPSLSVAFDGFDLDVGGVPGAVVNLFEGKIGAAAAGALADALATKLPELAEARLAELIGRSVALPILGHILQVTAVPRQLDVDATGIAVAIDAKLVIEGAEDAEYPASPQAPGGSLLAGVPGFGLAVADDLVNQLLAGAWAAGALTQSVPLPPGGVAQAFFGVEVDRVAVELALPPVVTIDAGGLVTLQLGDVLVRAIDDDTQATLAEVALSVRVPLEVSFGTTGTLALRLGEPIIDAQILTWSDDLPRRLADAELAELGGMMFGQVAIVANDMLAGMPLPAVAGARVTAPSLDSQPGYLRVRGNLELP